MTHERLGDIEDIFARLKLLRDSYHEEIPAKIIQSNCSEDIRFKVRKGWFQSLGSVLEDGIGRGDIANQELVAEIELFWQWIESDEFQGGYAGDRLTTQADIDCGNAMINRVLTTYRPEWVPKQ